MFIEKTDERVIRQYLSESACDIKIETVDLIDSTNEEMKRRAMKGEKEISLLIAEEQTKGMGTKGRSFFSPRSTGIYMSFLLRPEYSPEECTLLTTMAAVSTAKAIEKVTGKKAKIKWVNDIYIENRKAAGILTRAHFLKDNSRIEWAVVGIGINITDPEQGFPDEIADIAGTVGKIGEHTKSRIIAEIINSFTAYYRNLTKKEFIGEYSERLLWRSKSVTVTQGTDSYEATVTDIDSMCRLKVKLPDGSEKVLNSGEITIRK